MTDTIDRLKAALADRYLIERELGAGGMATVYLAQDFKHGRRVAVKVLKPELAAVLGAERFVQEIKTTASLQHPHILPLFDSGQADGFLYYVMPYIEGETLRDKLSRETQLGIEEAVKITTEVADALDYAHRQGVIHRDIKPENILLHDGRPMVADFGIALAVSAAAGGRMTETGLSLGTPHYMSPEQATAEKHVSNRSDIYSLGAVLYEMLTGDPPHTGSSAQAIIMKIVTEEAKPVTKARKSVPPNVAAATAKALQKLPADRFEDAARFGQALITASFVTSASLPGEVAAVQVGRRDWRVSALAVGVVVMTAVAGWALLRPAAPQPPPIRVSVPLPPGPLRVRDLVELSEDGNTLAIMVSVDGIRRVLVRQLGTDSVHILEESGGSTGGLAFSPDGRWLASSADGTLYKIPVAGGSPVPLSEANWGHPAWLGNDVIIYTPDYDRGLWRVSSEGRDPTELTRPDRGEGELGHWRPQVLPDGQHVLFTSFTTPASRSRLEVLSLKTGRRQVVQEGGYFGRYRAGRLFFVRGSTIMAVPFDLGRLATQGTPVPVLENVQVAPVEGTAAFSVAANGTMAYLKTIPMDRYVRWLDESGVDTPAIDSAGRYAEAVPSPDGRQLAVIRDGDIWTFDLNRRFFTRITRTEQFEGSLEWTPDSRTVVYRRDVPQYDIFMRAADAGTPEALVLNSVWDKKYVSVSSDGRFLLFNEQGNDRNDLKVIGFPVTSGDTSVTLMGGPGDQVGGEFSPDGRWIALQSDESGRDEVLLIPFPLDRGPARQRVSLEGGTNPKWAPDGRSIYYSWTRKIFRAPVNPSNGTVGRAEELPPIEGLISWDVAPDGRLLIVKTLDGSEERTVNLVLNWDSELDQR